MNAKEIPQPLDENGFSFLETLFVVSILLILITAAVFHGSSIYRNAILNYETQMLVSDIKLLQQMSRTSTYDQSNFPMEEKTPSSPEIVFYSDSYYMRTPGVYGKSFRRHKYAENVGVSNYNMSYLSFLPNGDTTHRKMGSLYLFWCGRGTLSRRVVIDTAGRIRTDR